MSALGEAGNVQNTALSILSQKGYQIWQDESGEYGAEKNGWDFYANSPIGLLGLIAIYEFKQPSQYIRDWWFQGNDPNITVFNLLDKPNPYISVKETFHKKY